MSRRSLLLAVFLPACASHAPPAAAPPIEHAAPPAPARAGDYFPLVAGATYDYSATFGEEVEPDVHVTVMTLAAGDRELFYFTDAPDATMVDVNNIGLSLFYKDGGTLMTIERMFLDDFRPEDADAGQPLLDLPPQVGGRHEVTYLGNATLGAAVARFEDVTVPAGTFHDCAVLELTKVFPDQGSRETGHAWLCPDVGLVRWERATGRVDVLTAVGGL